MDLHMRRLDRAREMEARQHVIANDSDHRTDTMPTKGRPMFEQTRTDKFWDIVFVPALILAAIVFAACVCALSR